MDYPVWDLAIGGGLLMALVAVPHVIVSHFAIGGGLVIAVTETLAFRRDDRELRELARRSSQVLILVSTVFGAISGVGIWVVAGLISPGAISALIHNYVWGWAIEWVFFILEIVAALLYYSTWDKISRRAHLMVIWLYVAAAYLSLVVINGIITFMLTPGKWLQTGGFWDGFFNPSYWPGLLLRTGICMIMATAFLVFSARRASVEARPRLLRYLGWWMVAGVLVAYAGYRWWEVVLPDSVRALFAAGAPLISGLDGTRSLTLWALTVVLALAAGVLIARPRAAGLPVAVLLMAASFVFFGSYERLREAVRKPFLIHSHMFSNGLRVDDIARINEQGMAAVSGWVAAAPAGSVARGREIYRVQCAACHTRNGYLSMRRALPTIADVRGVVADDPPGSSARVYAAECAACHPQTNADEVRQLLPSADEVDADPSVIAELNQGMILATLERLHDLGAGYLAVDRSTPVATAELEIPYMPPLVGSDQDVEALAAYLTQLASASPAGGEL